MKLNKTLIDNEISLAHRSGWLILLKWTLCQNQYTDSIQSLSRFPHNSSQKFKNQSPTAYGEMRNQDI